MILFAADLDNTLIYSYKKDIGDEKTCVEIYQNREIAFMSNHSLKLLKEVNQLVCFVPTTTRTKEQYDRIDFGIGVPKYALICNGGILLVNGKSDLTWYQDSLESIKECKETMDMAVRLLEEDPLRTFEVRYIEQLMIFTKSENPKTSIESISSKLDLSLVDVFQVGIKVYVVPKKLTKGNAVLRLKDKLHSEKVIAAGDSEFDVSMLKEADVGFAPSDFKTELDHLITCEDDQLFSDCILDRILATV